jgi:tetratricopeptide (TPR) repeat protein
MTYSHLQPLANMGIFPEVTCPENFQSSMSSSRPLAYLASLARRFRSGVFLFAVSIQLLTVHAVGQQILYDRYIKVQLPSGWVEKRSWELGEDRSLPLYHPRMEAVAFLWGFDRPLYRAGYIKSLATGDRLKRQLEIDLSRWPAESSRFYAMVSGGFAVRSNKYAATVGPSLRPAEVRYRGNMKIAGAEMELIEYLSQPTVDQDFAAKYKLRSELVGSKAQIFFGQATFEGRHGYTLIACRFTAQPDIDWLKPLMENVGPLPKGELKKGEEAEWTRDAVSHALEVSADQRYKQALEQLEAALKVSPQDDNALTVKAEILSNTDHLDEAEKLLRQAIQLNAYNDRAHFSLASVLWGLEKKDEAISELEMVQQISPLYPRIDEVLAQKKSQRPVTTAGSR